LHDFTTTDRFFPLKVEQVWPGDVMARMRSRVQSSAVPLVGAYQPQASCSHTHAPVSLNADSPTVLHTSGTVSLASSLAT